MNGGRIVKTWMVALGLCLLVIDSQAFAQDAATSGAGTASQPSDSGGVHMQDGFYASAAVGFGGFHDDMELNYLLGSIEGTVDGASGTTHLAIGGALKDGLILGGAVFVVSVQNPVIEVEGKRRDDDIAVGTLFVVGPFVDWYFTPGEGWHLLGAIGGARITVEDETGQRGDVDNEPVGGAAVVGIGHNWWFDDQWSVGALLRGGGGTLRANGLTHNVGFGSINLVLTYN